MGGCGTIRNSPRDPKERQNRGDDDCARRRRTRTNRRAGRGWQHPGRSRPTEPAADPWFSRCGLLFVPLSGCCQPLDAALWEPQVRTTFRLVQRSRARRASSMPSRPPGMTMSVSNSATDLSLEAAVRPLAPKPSDEPGRFGGDPIFQHPAAAMLRDQRFELRVALTVQAEAPRGLPNIVDPRTCRREVVGLHDQALSYYESMSIGWARGGQIECDAVTVTHRPR